MLSCHLEINSRIEFISKGACLSLKATAIELGSVGPLLIFVKSVKKKNILYNEI